MRPAFTLLEILGEIEPEEREGVMQIVTSWMKQGQAFTVLRQLKRKFGELDPEVEVQIQRLESTQLEELSEALLDFEEVGDLTAWLRNLE